MRTHFTYCGEYPLPVKKVPALGPDLNGEGHALTVRFRIEHNSAPCICVECANGDTTKCISLRRILSEGQGRNHQNGQERKIV
jgi:hypothetical protein